MTDLELFRVYQAAGQDGYPPEWHRLPEHLRLPGLGVIGIKDIVRQEAGDRCIRCGHPYLKGTAPIERTVVDGEEVRTSWSPCDEHCRHLGPMRVWTTEGWVDFEPSTADACGPAVYAVGRAEAAWRILTVHHLSGVKLDCRWHNLVALCQKCHLNVQRRVVMQRSWPWPHSPWFQPYAAAFYASKYLGEELTREQTMKRIDELLALGLEREAEERMPV